jgi:serine/threonine protein kinase
VDAQTARLAAALSGQYTILREVGAGGMATVYLAEDSKHGRKVALKVLRSELAGALAAERFPREIKTVAQFHHPHILSLYDSGEAQGILFYVMPFVEGESLRQRLDRDGQLPIQESIRILREVADALAYAHARGVVHRDIKPGNVMLAGRHAVVTDFGVAKALSASGQEKSTTVGIAVGTPQYMAPEQAMGESNVDHRADIYALGLLGYEMLSGRAAFDRPTPQAVLAAQVIEMPADIHGVRANLPPLLGEAIMKCLAKNREERWQSADELVAQLELIASTPSGGLTPTATKPHPTSRVEGVKPRSRSMVGIAAAVVLVLAVAGALFLKGNSGATGATSSGRIEKLGVMPIDDISGKDSVFVAAMHDALTSALARNGGVGVASRSAMMRYKATAKTTQQIAQEQSLGAIVEATVFRAGDVMRINVQLSDPVTSKVLWSETYEKDVKNVLAAQTEVVTLVATGIGTALNGTKTQGEMK